MNEQGHHFKTPLHITQPAFLANRSGVQHAKNTSHYQAGNEGDEGAHLLHSSAILQAQHFLLVALLDGYKSFGTLLGVLARLA
jgi:hypothetical protein